MRVQEKEMAPTPVFMPRESHEQKLQYFGYLIQRIDSFEKTLMLGKTEGRRRG